MFLTEDIYVVQQNVCADRCCIFSVKSSPSSKSTEWKIRLLNKEQYNQVQQIGNVLVKALAAPVQTVHVHCLSVQFTAG